MTPFTPDGDLDLDAAQKVASYLVDSGNDGLVVSGTTGESPTTTIAEDGEMLRAVLDAVGDRATVVAGVGTNDTRHSIELAEQAAKAGAHGLLLVTPYYSKPPQAGIVAHIRTVAQAGQDTPVMLYDIPGRTGTQLAEETYLQLAGDTAIVAVKDAVGDLIRGTWIMRETGMKIYSGDDPLNFAWLTHGAAGVVSVVGHVAARQYADLVAAIDRSDLPAARALHEQLLPAVKAMMTITQGAISSKAALQMLGVLEHRTVRAPLIEPTDEQTALIRAGLVDAGLLES